MTSPRDEVEEFLVEHFAEANGVGPDADENDAIEPEIESKVDSSSTPKPEIKIVTDIERMTDDAIGALAVEGKVYQRAGMLVRPVYVPEGPKVIEEGIERWPGTSTIQEYSKGAIKERLSTAAVWKKYDARSKIWKTAKPDGDVASALAGRGFWEKIPVLTSVVSSPQLRPDGSILQTPGYDAKTGLLYQPRCSFPHVSEHPNLADAKAALEAIREVVCDFPFEDKRHESAWIAGNLTMVARAAIDGCVPMFAVDANTRGSGKSRLVDAASAIAYGHHAPRCAMARDDEEMRKRITSIVLNADASVLIDNVRTTLQSPSLEALLTATTWKDRLLGVNKDIVAPHRTVWWASGNNLEIGGDLHRRTLHIRIHSPLENPEERTGFKHDPLLPWVLEHRPRLLVAALTLLRAYMISGETYHGGLWGSFEEWSRLICGAIVWAGAVDPIAARATASADDDERAHVIVAIEAMKQIVSSYPLTAREIIERLYGELKHDQEFDSFREAIETETRCEPGKVPDARRFGKWFQRIRGRVVGGWNIARDPSRDVAAWSARRAETANA